MDRLPPFFRLGWEAPVTAKICFGNPPHWVALASQKQSQAQSVPFLMVPSLSHPSPLHLRPIPPKTAMWLFQAWGFQISFQKQCETQPQPFPRTRMVENSISSGVPICNSFSTLPALLHLPLASIPNHSIIRLCFLLSSESASRSMERLQVLSSPLSFLRKVFFGS